jgi:hypothetical protein
LDINTNNPDATSVYFLCNHTNAKAPRHGLPEGLFL